MSIRSINQKALKIFNQTGFPHQKNEYWKYTNLKKFKSLKFSQSNNFNYSKNNFNYFEFLDIPTITILNGKIISLPQHLEIDLLSNKLEDSLSGFHDSFSFDDLNQAKNNPFLVLNTAYFSNGIYLKMNQNFDNVLIKIISNNTSENPESSYSRIYVDLEEGSSSKILLHHIGLDQNQQYYKNNVLSLNANRNSKASILNIYEESKTSYSMNNIILNQSQDSNIKQSSFYLSSGFIRTDIKNNLNGTGASSLMDGLFLGNDSQFIDNNIIINHNTEQTDSRVLYKGILDGNSQGVFNALVDVPFKSKNINSDQKNHNILLSKKARINSNPKLKISCDAVKCSHGSTIGNLDPDELFYLRSRGINLKKSKKILLDSFMNEIIQNSPFQDITNYINTRIDKLV
tara:strand:- start:2833 stop:4035 length:1203 start_codon:yes stop_codon:yes gene_type:complete